MTELFQIYVVILMQSCVTIDSCLLLKRRSAVRTCVSYKLYLLLG